MDDRTKSWAQRWLWMISTRVLQLVVMGWLVAGLSYPAVAITTTAQLGGMEETDGRIKPGLGLGIEQGSYGAQLFVWGQKVGPIKDYNGIASVYYRVPLFQTAVISARLGGSLLYEYIGLDISGDSASESDVSLAVLGGFDVIAYQYQGWRIGGFWDSYLVYLDLPLLVSWVIDRKLTFGLTFSYDWDS